MARKKQTPLQKEYMKQVHRIQNIISRAKRQGYTFPTDFAIPEMPKRVTKASIAKLKEIKPVTVLKTAVYVEQDTGEVKPATQKRKEVKKKGGQKAKRTREAKKAMKKPTKLAYGIKDTLANLILDKLRKMVRPIAGIDIAPLRNKLIRILEDTITEYDGKEAELDEYLRANEENISRYMVVLQYDSKEENVQNSFIELARILAVGELGRQTEEELEEMTEQMSWGVDEAIMSGEDYYNI